jgi:hypothetical protein
VFVDGSKLCYVLRDRNLKLLVVMDREFKNREEVDNRHYDAQLYSSIRRIVLLFVELFFYP